MIQPPPHSKEAEQSLLGALLLDNQAYESVSWLSEGAFYADQHRRIWRAVARALDAGRSVDIATLCDELGPDLAKAGGPAYFGALAQNTPSALNIRRYAELVRDKAVLRELVRRAGEIGEKAMAGTQAPLEIAEEAEVSILSVLDSAVGANGDIVHIGQAATEYVEWVDEHPNGIETGLRDLDALTGGFLPGNLIVVAGRTHMGKTALALQFCEHICAREPGIIFSLEAQRREIAGRLIGWHKNKGGRDKAVDNVFRLKFFVDESSTLTAGLMRARLRRMKRQHGLSLVVVDYLQLMRGRGDSREQEVASISRDLKAIAKEFQVPVVALSQLNRKVEERTDKRPHMADLRESGAIEQDADLVLLTYRPDYYDENFTAPMAEAELLVPKNRNNGRTGLVKVMFSREIGRFGDFIPERFRPSMTA